MSLQNCIINNITVYELAISATQIAVQIVKTILDPSREKHCTCRESYYSEGDMYSIPQPQLLP